MPVSSLVSKLRLRFTPDPYCRQRRKTRVVPVGSVSVGGENPIRLQSMTTTDTLNVDATVAQSLKMADAGCEIIRITAPTVKAARALEEIKSKLLKAGCHSPLVADIHFDPAAAMAAADFVEKVRINPGNFVDSKRFASREYTDAEYAAELARIEEKFTPLVKKLKRLGRALRIGTNHGSLSDRIMNRYGDSPLGMVESALEFVRIAEKNGYYDIILSMKSSNPKVMIAAYRLLAARMDAEGMDYPFHLGVTEAGDGEDGRIKSAVGIGSLLEDGIGDTIRVSLTEDPELEIPVCRIIARRFNDPEKAAPQEKNEAVFIQDPFSYSRRETDSVRVGPFRLGGLHPVRAVTRWKAPPAEILAFLEEQLQAPQALEPEILEWDIASDADILILEKARAELAQETSRLAFLVRPGPQVRDLDKAFALADALAVGEELLEKAAASGKPLWLESANAEKLASLDVLCRSRKIPCVLSLSPSALHEQRRLAARLLKAGSKTPLHLQASPEPDLERQTVETAIFLGSLLCDGIGDSVQILGPADPKDALRLVYNTLQAAGVRVTKTEYVSCPSCGRTLFDLQETTERIKSKTGHLKGVKIAIMGCIVNGPGEMADADFGYVGGAPDKINLYVGKNCVQKGIPSETADQALIDLIKTHGKWVEAPNAA